MNNPVVTLRPSSEADSSQAMMVRGFEERLSFEVTSVFFSKNKIVGFIFYKKMSKEITMLK